jgi:hypothetical protein
VETDTARHDDDEPPRRRGPEPDFAWGRTANPNTADGELQNLAAFGSGLSRLTGRRRQVAAFVVWLILLGFALTAIFGVLGIVGLL